MGRALAGSLFVKRFIFLSACIFGSLFLRSDGAWAATDKDKDYIDVNPLLTFAEQLEEINEECANRGIDRECEERRAEIKENMKKLRQICRKKPDDSRCGALSSGHKDVVSTIETFCREHPHEERCVRRHEITKRAAKRKAKYCAKNPDSKRCLVRVEKPKGAAALAEYCQVFPERRRCVRWKEALEKSKENKTNNDDNGGSF